MTDVNTVKRIKSVLTSSADDLAVQTLRAIEIAEENLQAKRSQIEEIRMRRKQLVYDIEQLDKSLGVENSVFVPKLNAVFKDNDTVGDNVGSSPDMPVATEISDLETFLGSTNKQVPPSPDEMTGARNYEGWLKNKGKEHRDRMARSKSKR